jgi:hypothetical protein
MLLQKSSVKIWMKHIGMLKLHNKIHRCTGSIMSIVLMKQVISLLKMHQHMMYLKQDFICRPDDQFMKFQR